MTQLFAKTRISAAGLALVACMALAAPPAQANVDIQQVKSEKGITAWLVEDYSVPIVTIRFSFKGGNTQDPEGKEGLSELMSGLFDEVRENSIPTPSRSGSTMPGPRCVSARSATGLSARCACWPRRRMRHSIF